MWLEFDSLVNARDVGGTPTLDGDAIRSGRLFRSDNLQALTAADIARLLELEVTDVIDLRSAFEVYCEGPGPLTGHAGVNFHHYSFIAEPYDVAGLQEAKIDKDMAAIIADRKVAENALPLSEAAPSPRVMDKHAASYLGFLNDRPESVVAALRAIAYASGAALVHCAAGKDRTGTTVALSLLLAGAEPGAVIEDYAASSERVQLIVDRLLVSETYRPLLAGRPLEGNLTRPETMQAFLEYAESEYGGIEPMLLRMGWTDTDTAAMRKKLRS